MRGARLSSVKKNKPSESGGQKSLTVECITDNEVEKIIFGEEIKEGEKKIFTGVLNTEPIQILEGDNYNNRDIRRRSSSKGTLKETENEINIPKNKRLRASLRNTPKSLKKIREEQRIIDEVDSDSDVEDIFKDKTTIEKPSGLCDDDEVAGNEMCSFRTPKKRQGMYKKAQESAGKVSNLGTPMDKPYTPTRPGTPLSSSKLNHGVTSKRRNSSVKRLLSHVQTPNKSTPLRKGDLQSISSTAETPYNLRTRQKKAIQDHMRSLSAFDDNEDSDYRGSDDSSSESDSSPEDEHSSSDSGKGSEEPKPHCRRSLKFQSTSSTKKKVKDPNYVFTADEYFENQAGKCKTSDHKLSRLQTPRLENTTLQKLLSSCSVSHARILSDLRKDDLSMFQRWMFALSQGFNILAYGLGSKHSILQNFHREMLPDSHVVVVNGFFPSFSIKEVVEMVARDLLGLKQILPSPHTIIDWIESRRHMPRVFLIVHNIDGEPLRNDKTQQILSRLASLPKVHLVASVDHINCPLLWDQAKLSGFNFMWEDATSFLPYQEETSYETSLMVQNSGSLALSSLLNVYHSLTQNSRGVFRIILEKHLEENNKKYIGMAFSTLYKKCRDEMLVTNDLTLHTMLTEFFDHQMVKTRRDSEHLYIPVEIGVLQQFYKIIQDS